MGISGDWEIQSGNIAEVAATPLAELDDQTLSAVAYGTPDTLASLLEHARNADNTEMVGAIGAFAFLGARISALESEGGLSQIPTVHNHHSPAEYLRVAKLVFGDKKP